MKYVVFQDVNSKLPPPRGDEFWKTLVAQHCPLPFGRNSAVLHYGAHCAAEAMATVLPSLRMLNTSAGSSFVSKSAKATVGMTSMLAHASSPCHLEIEQAEGWHIVVPYIGSGIIKSENNYFSINAGVNAVILPNSRREALRRSGSTAIFSIDVDYLNKLLRSNYQERFRIEPNISHAYDVIFDHSGKNFRAFSNICNFIDSHFQDQTGLNVLGFDDVIHRWIASCLFPSDTIEPTPRETVKIDIVCDVVRSAVDRPLTLTEMERLSGLSARALQYAFKARFGCSPMQWQRSERLLEAQRRVLSMAPGESITTIAYSMGFSSSSAFSALYKRQFGETPSETLLRNR